MKTFMIPAWVALVRRDLVTDLRKLRPFLCLLLTVTCCMVVLYVIWPRAGRHGRPLMPEDMGRVSKGIVFAISSALMVACCLLVPALAAFGIVEERRRETMDQLRLTMIGPKGLTFSKLLNAVGVFLLILVGIFPVGGCLLFVPGLDWRELLGLAGLLLICALSYAAAGLWCSARFYRPHVALGASYGMMLVLNGVFLAVVPAILLAFGAWGFASVWSDMCRMCSYFSPLAALVMQHSRARRWPSTPLSIPLAVQACWAFLCFWMAMRTLRRPEPVRKVDLRKPIDDPEELRRRRERFPFYLIDPLRRSRPIEDGRNPMYVREIRYGMLSRATGLVRRFYWALGLSGMGVAGYLVGNISSSVESVVYCLMLETFLLIVITPALVVNTFMNEYETGSFDMLRSTLLTSREVMRGKLVAGLISVMPLVVGTILGTWAGVFVWQRTVAALFWGSTCLVVHVFTTVGLTLLCAVQFKRTPVVLAAAYLMTGILLTMGHLIPLVSHASARAGFILSQVGSWPLAVAVGALGVLVWAAPQGRLRLLSCCLAALAALILYARFTSEEGAAVIWAPIWALEKAFSGHHLELKPLLMSLGLGVALGFGAIGLATTSFARARSRDR